MSIRNLFSAAMLLGAAILGTKVECEAQIRIQFYSAHAQNNAPPDDCLRERDILLPLMLSYDHPADWTWIIACDEEAWSRVEAHMGQVSIASQPYVTTRILASTDLETRLTYIRGFAILHPFTDQAEAQPEHTVAHELSHIMLNSHDEAEVEARTWLVMKHSTQAKVAPPRQKALTVSR